MCIQTHKHTHTHRHILFIRDTGAYGTVDGLYSSNPAEALRNIVEDFTQDGVDRLSGETLTCP